MRALTVDFHPVEFIEGIQWRRLTAEERNGREWKYIFRKDVTAISKSRLCYGTYYCFDGDGNLWFILRPFSMTVMAGYAWNGCSKAPDLEGMMLASGFHDPLYQFSGYKLFPLERKQCDDTFYVLSADPTLSRWESFTWECKRQLYWRVLRAAGWSHWARTEPGARIVKEHDQPDLP